MQGPGGLSRTILLPKPALYQTRVILFCSGNSDPDIKVLHREKYHEPTRTNSNGVFMIVAIITYFLLGSFTCIKPHETFGGNGNLQS